MAVFDGSVKTTRRVVDPISDKLVTSMGSITLPAINTSAALPYPGSDVSVVHGNQQLHVDENRIVKIDMNHDVLIGELTSKKDGKLYEKCVIKLLKKHHRHVDQPYHRRLLQDGTL
jgi:hypothetical protein